MKFAVGRNVCKTCFYPVLASHLQALTHVRHALFRNLAGSTDSVQGRWNAHRVKGTTEQTYEQFARMSDVGIPIMLQDAPLSGVDLPVGVLARMAREIEQLKLFKMESAGAASNIRALIAEGDDTVEGPLDGEEGITLMADLVLAQPAA